jgi:hypothetical protein
VSLMFEIQSLENGKEMVALAIVGKAKRRGL